MPAFTSGAGTSELQPQFGLPFWGVLSKGLDQGPLHTQRIRVVRQLPDMRSYQARDSGLRYQRPS